MWSSDWNFGTRLRIALLYTSYTLLQSNKSYTNYIPYSIPNLEVAVAYRVRAGLSSDWLIWLCLDDVLRTGPINLHLFVPIILHFVMIRVATLLIPIHSAHWKVSKEERGCVKRTEFSVQFWTLIWNLWNR